MMTDTNELRRLAEAAQAEPWWNEDTFGEHHGFTDEDMRFIAAASPATVLGLLDKIDALNAAWMDDLEMSLQYLRESNEAREAVKRLTGALETTGHSKHCYLSLVGFDAPGDACDCYRTALYDPIVKRIVEGE